MNKVAVAHAESANINHLRHLAEKTPWRRHFGLTNNLFIAVTVRNRFIVFIKHKTHLFVLLNLKLQDKIKYCGKSRPTNSNSLLLKQQRIMKKNCKVYNSCKANSNIYIKQQYYFFDSQGTYSFASDLYNSLMAQHANSCLIWMYRRISDALKYIQNILALCSIN